MLLVHICAPTSTASPTATLMDQSSFMGSNTGVLESCRRQLRENALRVSESYKAVYGIPVQVGYTMGWGAMGIDTLYVTVMLSVVYLVCLHVMFWIRSYVLLGQVCIDYLLLLLLLLLLLFPGILWIQKRETCLCPSIFPTHILPLNTTRTVLSVTGGESTGL